MEPFPNRDLAIHIATAARPPEDRMATTDTDLMTAANIAKDLGVSDAKVKKAIKELGLEPDAKKGVCCYYGESARAKIKKQLA